MKKWLLPDQKNYHLSGIKNGWMGECQGAQEQGAVEEHHQECLEVNQQWQEHMQELFSINWTSCFATVSVAKRLYSRLL